jgi:hypothetical protein
LSSSLRVVALLDRCETRTEVALLVCGVTDAMGAQYISHLAVTAVAEHARNRGMHFQAAYDDLSKHAIAFRQMCLFLRKPAGREAYPSDVFFLHARLLERSCNLGRFGLAGSLMSLPVVETLNNDLSAYIATNVISITDGQLYLDIHLFGIGCCPAISPEKSVSRVGAKSLDVLNRAIAFALYTTVGAVKQEAELAVRSAGFAERATRSNQFSAMLVQRNCQARHVSTFILLGVATGITVTLPVKLLTALLLATSELSLGSITPRVNIDNTWAWQIFETEILHTSLGQRTVRRLVSSLRLLVSVCWMLLSGLSVVGISSGAVTQQTFIAMNAATSILVDLTAASTRRAAGNSMVCCVALTVFNCSSLLVRWI